MNTAATLTPQQGFDRMAYTYDARLANHPVPRLESQAMLSLLPDVTGARVADIGCGTGRYALQIARCGAANVVGVDVSMEMLAVARRKAIRGELGDIAWKQGDISALPLDSGTFHTAVCALTLSFTEDIRGAFREMARILAPGGTLLISDTHPHGLLRERAENGGAFTSFMDADGLDYRIPQYPHTVTDFFHAAQDADLTLRSIAEPAVDRETCRAHTALRDSLGIPLVLILGFTKG